jgi:hypothetical protein
MAAVETIRVKEGKGSKVINLADYDEKEHGKPVADPKPAKKAEATEPEAK